MQAHLCLGVHASADDSTAGTVPCAVQHSAEQTVIVLVSSGTIYRCRSHAGGASKYLAAALKINVLP